MWMNSGGRSNSPMLAPKSMKTLTCFAAAFTIPILATTLFAQEPSLIVHHGKVVTVDQGFSVRQAMAVKDGRILRVGSDDEVLRLKGPRTEAPCDFSHRPGRLIQQPRPEAQRH